jgi:hypothetical protein
MQITKAADKLVSAMPQVLATPAKQAEAYLHKSMFASLGWSTEEMAQNVGLDSAMLLEYTSLCCKILTTMALPLLLVMPLNWHLGGGGADDGDTLGRLSMKNIKPGSKYAQWLFLVHAVLVWVVVLVTKTYTYAAQARFVQLRFKWLRDLSGVRATTVLVQAIPEEFRSDAKLKDFFAGIFRPEEITQARVLKHTHALTDMACAKKSLEELKKHAELTAEKQAAGGSKGAKFVNKATKYILGLGKSKFKDLRSYEDDIMELEEKIRTEQTEIRRASEKVGGVNTNVGFVTFRRRREALIAEFLRYSENEKEWIVSNPPEPANVNWDELKGWDPHEVVGVAGVDDVLEEVTNRLPRIVQVALRRGYKLDSLEELKPVVGFALYAALLFFFGTITLGVSYAVAWGATRITQPLLSQLWVDYAQAGALSTLLGFMPTIFLLITSKFYTHKSDTWKQFRLQMWYYWFLVVHVVLVTAFGTSVLATFCEIIDQPTSILQIMARSLPTVSNFYLKWLVLQWVTQGMGILRLPVLVKFNLFKTIYPEAEASTKSEPEDQDYYGIGARSARFSINMTIGVIFSTISPFTALLGAVTFALNRITYGHLVLFAECRKNDLGGVFWVEKLRQILYALMMYCAMMTGLFTQLDRADWLDWLTFGLAVSALLYAIRTSYQFRKVFRWEQQPVNELAFQAERFGMEIEALPSSTTREADEAYLQPELRSEARDGTSRSASRQDGQSLRVQISV